MNYEILKFEGTGYKELMRYNSWKVAVLNYIDELEIENLSYVEAHLETDEIFVLLKGEATLIFYDPIVKKFSYLKLEPYKVYNVKLGIFHTHVISKDCSLLIVEESNTSETNSKRIYLTDEDRLKIKENL